MNILIFAGKIVAGTKVLILIFYQKLPSETISYNIINIFTSQWMGDRPFYRFDPSDFSPHNFSRQVRSPI
ncbi:MULTISPECIES: hypothetical protein [unclassified Microcoleus]|uniref:hypothetical protein n=1 Tax=unclassified Microcoleus TaxID=2642155 RepID=UPI0025D1AB92|nr:MULTISPECIES: hypothetical protein [unclassified Microcoleus]